jgi:alanyl-tRNA synthetase
VLGEHVKQSGSYVGPDRLRFDFSHYQPMTPEEIEAVEKLVNEQILKNLPVQTEIMDVESARKSGAVALFGEKYGDTVRVVSVGDFSRELCGGTHVQHTGQIGPFLITLETGIASGVRRLEAVTGREAINYMLAAKRFRKEAAAIVGRTETEALDGVRQLREDNLTLQKEIKKIKTELFAGAVRPVGTETSIGDLRVVTHDFAQTDTEVMSSWIDSQKARHDAVVALGMGVVNGKITYMASASHAAVAQWHIDVGSLSKQLLPQFGGRGGGKSSFAQGTVAQGTTPQELFEAARELIKKEVAKQNV